MISRAEGLTDGLEVFSDINDFMVKKLIENYQVTRKGHF